MPELPEVETFKKHLSVLIKGQEVYSVKLFNEKSLKENEFYGINVIKGQKIISVERVAKYLIFNFKNASLISHLRMEGKWNLYSEEEFSKINPNYLILSISFLSGSILAFSDFRKFATLDLIKNDGQEQFFKNKKIAPEPWDIDIDVFSKKILSSKKYIKTILLDQSIISGIGNIYADEILFISKLHPLKRGFELSNKDILNLLKFSKLILKKSIEEGGSSIRTYASVNGKIGNYQNFLKVHLQEGKQCFDNEHFVKKIKVNGRGTYYCEGVQK